MGRIENVFERRVRVWLPAEIWVPQAVRGAKDYAEVNEPAVKELGHKGLR